MIHPTTADARITVPWNPAVDPGRPHFSGYGLIGLPVAYVLAGIQPAGLLSPARSEGE
jgi:hypothetical protein